MLRSLNELTGYRIDATDGDIGRLDTIYFDDQRWTVRYLVVDTGGWLSGRKVLVSPFAFGEAPVVEGGLRASLTREQVKNSPPIDTARPVSRQHEWAYHQYYGYPPYWAGSGVWGAAAYPVAATAGAPPQTAESIDQEPGDSHLRDASAVRGHHIAAIDGELGHVEDYLIDDRSWTIRYLVVDTSNWLGGRRVLIAPEWVETVSWEGATVQVGVTQASIEAAPSYDGPAAVDDAFERRLHEHYVEHRRQDAGRPTSPTSSASTRVARLGELTDLQVADGQPDVRGWRVVARDGLLVGRVTHLVADPSALTVPFLEVGLERDGAAPDESPGVLVPTSSVDLDRGTETVRVRDLTADRVAALPSLSRSEHAPPAATHLRPGFGPRQGLRGGTNG